MYRTCSINKVIAKFYRDFKPSNSGWNQDAIEWIGEALEIMRIGTSYQEIDKEVEIFDYRAKIPCDVSVLMGIEHNGFQLPINGGVNYNRGKRISKISNKPYCVTNSFNLNPNYIETSFKEGCIRVYYWGLPVDCDGFPEIIDDPKVEEALIWYILMKLLGRGFKHQVFTYTDAEQRWNNFYPKAQNRFVMKDTNEHESFMRTYLGIAKDPFMGRKFLNTLDSVLNVNANNPGDLVQTFPLIGPNLNNV